MTAIATPPSYGGDISALLTPNTPSASIAPAAASGAADPSASAPSGTDSSRDPATRVDLSDKVKNILAKASTDQDVADRLKAFVEAHRTNAAANAAPADPSSAPPSGQSSSSSQSASTTTVDVAFTQLSGGTPADDTAAPVQAVKDFATGLKADGYSISAIARASDGSSQIEIVGPDGKSFLDRRFGTTGEFSSFSGIGAGQAAQSYQSGNKEYITFSESEAASVNVATASNAGTASATSTGTHTASTTFVVDFSTGSISLLQSESTSVSTTAQVSGPASSFSTLA